MPTSGRAEKTRAPPPHRSRHNEGTAAAAAPSPSSPRITEHCTRAGSEKAPESNVVSPECANKKGIKHSPRTEFFDVFAEKTAKKQRVLKLFNIVTILLFVQPDTRMFHSALRAFFVGVGDDKVAVASTSTFAVVDVDGLATGCNTPSKLPSEQTAAVNGT